MRLLLDRSQVRHDLLPEVVTPSGRFARIHSRLQIAIQEFIGVELRRVAGQEEYFDLVPVLLKPSLDGFTVVDPQVVEDQEDLTPRILDQSLHESNQDVGRQVFSVQHETHRPLVADRRNQVDSLPLALGEDQNRRPSLWGITSRVVLNGRNARFIAPTNFSALRFGPSGNRRIVRIQPLFDCLRFLLKGSLERPLRGEAPAIQVAPNRPARQVNQKALPNVRPDCLGIPECKAQLHLIRRLVHNVCPNAFLLSSGQRPSLTNGTATLGFFGAAPASRSVDPGDDRGTSHPQLGGNSRLGATPFMQPDRRLAELLSGGRLQFPCINSLCFHEQIIP